MAKSFLRKVTDESSSASEFDWKAALENEVERELTVNFRIEKLIFELRLNKKDFAISIGKDPSVITQMVQGRNKPGFDVLEKILKTYPLISSEWLMKGEGEMFKKSENEQSSSESKSQDGGAFGREVIDILKRQLEEKDQQLKEKDIIIKSLIDKVRVGKFKVSPRETAFVFPQKKFNPGMQIRVHQLSN